VLPESEFDAPLCRREAKNPLSASFRLDKNGFFTARRRTSSALNTRGEAARRLSVQNDDLASRGCFSHSPARQAGGLDEQEILPTLTKPEVDFAQELRILPHRMATGSPTINHRPSSINLIGRIRELPALLLLLMVLVWVLAAKPAFRTPENLAQVGQEAGLLGILACGEALVILTGGIDLSIGAAVAVAACVAGWRMTGGAPWPAAALLGLLAGGLAGWINGALITYRRLPPILVTLASLLLYRAGTNVATGAVPFNQLPDGFLALGRGFTPFLVFLVVTAAFAVVLARARFGRRVVAVGGSEQAARLSGVPVNPILRRVYLLSGLCAGLAGLLTSAATNSAQWNLADGWELDVIASVVIGGVRLTGGEGSVLGAALGALIIVALRNALFLSGVPNEQYGLITGAVILLAALAEQFRRVREAKTTA
jgi:ribose transport system permease protein